MKIKKLVCGLFLSTALAAGVGVLVDSQKESVEVKAAATSQSLIVKFGGYGNWAQANAKLGVYVWNSNGNAWTNLVSLDTSKVLYKLDFTLDGAPNNMIISRQNSSATSGSFDTSWAQTGDLSFNEATYISISEWNIDTTSGWKLSADVRSSLVPSFGTKTTLSKIGINGDGNPEVSGSVTLEKNEEFKMLAGDGVWSGYYGRPDALKNAISGGSQTGRSDQNPNIKCEIAGTYDFYFDTETKRLWISRQDIVDADGWATYFNSHVGCDETGKTLPSGWSSCTTEYGKLSAAAKDYVYGANANPDGDNLGKALATYDHAVAAHPNLTKFIVDSSSTPRSGAINVNPAIQELTNSGAMITVVAITTVSLAAIGGYFLFKKKHN